MPRGGLYFLGGHYMGTVDIESGYPLIVLVLGVLFTFVTVEVWLALHK